MPMLSFENQLFYNQHTFETHKEQKDGPLTQFPSKVLTNTLNKSSNLKKDTGQVWMLTTYPPRECGIATFSQDLFQSIYQVFGSGVDIKIAAIDKKKEGRNYPAEVGYIFEADDPCSYKKFAEYINNRPGILSLVIQHEFGLFPSAYHEHFNRMLHEIKKPVLVVMHTVLPSPDFSMKEKVTGMVQAITRVIVMTNNSAGLLQKHYEVPVEKVVVIPHGTHLSGHLRKDTLKERHGLKGRTVLSTFGLIGRNKNIETTLKALPEIIQKYPDVTFLVLGRTHPGVIREEGETYRRGLEELVKKNSLQNHVQFINRYLSLDELLEYLGATDIYLFTSKDPGQAVSGTFSYALSAGCAIVSTPIPHAKELHDVGNGLLFEFENPQSLARQIFRYLDDPGFREELSRKAIETMAGTAWSNIANRYMDLLKKICGEKLHIQYHLQPVNIEHLKTLTTDTGLLQFARYHQPDRESGYTLDDNARALVVTTILYRKTHSPEILELAKTYLKFILDCQLADGSFINYRNEDGSVSNDNNAVNLDDSNGRAIWALGYFINMGRKLRLPPTGRAIDSFLTAIAKLESIQSPRAIAFILKGLFYYNSLNPSLPDSLFEKLAEKLAALYSKASTENWKWFEPYLTYANGVLPEAMLIAYQVTSRDLYKRIAAESFDFFLSKIFPGNQLKVIPNKSWLNKGDSPKGYGEQPIDVAYTILALDRFYSVLENEEYADKLKIAFNWFYGANHLKRIIYNPSTGGCFDGLEERGVNLNQGAESTVCYLLARLVAGKYYDDGFANSTKLSYAGNPESTIGSDNLILKSTLG